MRGEVSGQHEERGLRLAAEATSLPFSESPLSRVYISLHLIDILYSTKVLQHNFYLLSLFWEIKVNIEYCSRYSLQKDIIPNHT